MKVNLKDFATVIGNGAIGSPGVADGRVIPVLILDCVERPDILDIVLFHQDKPPGDVVSIWAKHFFDSSVVYLDLEFKRPTPGKIIIKFDLRKNTLLVDKIFQANAVYIQPSNFGLKVADGINKPKILVEVHTSGAPFNWDSLCDKWTRKRLRQSGFSGKELKTAAIELIKQNRMFSRIPSAKSADPTIP